MASAILPGTTQENAPKGREQRVVNQAQANQVNMVVLTNIVVLAKELVLANIVVLAKELVLANKVGEANKLVLANKVFRANKVVLANKGNKLHRNEEEANKEWANKLLYNKEGEGLGSQEAVLVVVEVVVVVERRVW